MPKVSGNQKAGGTNDKPRVDNNKPAPKGPGISGNKPVSGGGGGNAATPPAQIWNPGVENPAIQPFLTQQDIEEYAEAREQYAEGLKELDRNYEGTKHNTEFETAELEKGRIASRDTENWDAAGRGLFRSSIRDADLADIDATAEIKKKFLSDQLQALAVYNQGQKASMEAKWNRYMEGLHRKEASNAEEAGANMPKYSVEPHFENAPGPPQQQPKQEPKGPNFKRNEPIGFSPGHQQSKNGGITAPSESPSVSNRMKPAAAKSIAQGHVAGKLYG